MTGRILPAAPVPVAVLVPFSFCSALAAAVLLEMGGFGVA